ncbi:hypothetical protein AVEN_47456-1 [Araneus ventricosus]|uniref:Uncharacterized protein n=1 Tax=Araneus ventricosus TaxID=182803 RepID=A0A4Y2IQ64_ARAVE|nr:hypothetical protein AVEN_47456-1 [Araneus ventricosus]
MTRTTPELALLSSSSRTTPTGWRLTTTCDLTRNKPRTTESGFEPGILQPRSQDLATAAPLQFAELMSKQAIEHIEPSHSGRGGLVVRSRLWGRKVPGSKPDSTEDPPCMGPAT